MATAQPAARFVRVDHHVSQQLGAEEIVLDIQRGLYHGLNEVGSFIWRELAQPRTIEELSERVSSRFEVTANVCRPDAQRFVALLLEAGLVQTVS